MSQKEVAVIVGTRPEVLKMAPVLLALRQRSASFRSILLSTGQHREMLDQGLKVFDLRPDIELATMRHEQSLARLSARLAAAFDDTFHARRPDIILVQGDTTSAFVASLIAYYHGIPVGHVEAGLRTASKRNPFPEEINRRLVSCIADVHFAPTDSARQNLLRDGISGDAIHVTGNPIVDSLQLIASSTQVQFDDPEIAGWRRPSARLVLVTAHRRENFGRGLQEICRALRTLAQRYADVQFLFPVHMNRSVSLTVTKNLSGVSNIKLTGPLDYRLFVGLMQQCYFILTDSGGIQEEAPTFAKPVLVMRETTERPEGVSAGCAALVGIESDSIVASASALLDSSERYKQMALRRSPYGDGCAAMRIATIVAEKLGVG